jgi:hypothetical protein
MHPELRNIHVIRQSAVYFLPYTIKRSRKTILAYAVISQCLIVGINQPDQLVIIRDDNCFCNIFEVVYN